MLSATMLSTDGLHVGRLRLHAGSDATRMRQRIEAQLQRMDVSSLGLTPRALLFVRRLSPRVHLHRAAPADAFGQGVRSDLRRLATRARRPWLHDDAMSAEDVCFADEAELIACLLRDWVRGALAQRWWWQGVLGHLGVLSWLRVQALVRADRLVPALAMLAERGDAVACVARLDEPDAMLAWRSVQRVYGLSELVDASSVAPVEPPMRQSAASSSPAAQAVGAAVAEPPALRRLLALVPELRSPTLRPAQRRLLGLALTLVREPDWARTPAFAAVCMDGRSVDRAGPDAPATPRPSSRQPRSSPGATRPKRDAISDDRVASVADVTAAKPSLSAGSDPVAPSGFATSVDSAARIEPSNDRRIAPSQADDTSLPASAGTALDLPAETIAAPPPRAAAPRRAPTAAWPAAATRSIRTRYGGIFYLLNAALALRIYGDFTMPRTPGLALSPWNLLAWTGQAWFGDDFVRDPVWPLLASLAGRKTGRAPGRAFAAPSRWQLDAGWLAPWGPVERLQVQATRRRLRLLHPKGFAVADVARDPAERPLQQARALCADVSLLHGATLARARPGSKPVARRDAARWLQHWLSYLNARLGRTLDSDDAAALLCRHEAVVAVTVGSVDVHLALAALPLPVRYAGLDRDPGWIPAAGRSLMFRFA